MRGVLLMVLLAVASWTTAVQAGSVTGFNPAAEIQGLQVPVQRASHGPDRPVLLQHFLHPRRSAQPRRLQRQPARVAPRRVARPARRAAPAPRIARKPARAAARRIGQAQQAKPIPAALVPRPAPAVRNPAERTIAPKYLPTTVVFETDHEPGTVVVDPEEKFLYVVQEDGEARRYGIAVGREGFGWSGTVRVGRKSEWPTWTPPKEMIQRQPWLARYADGMPGGPNNPLGARALYLYKNDHDTLFRIHGSNEPWTIGQAVSSGCFRMRNEDITELFELIPVGTKVVVL